MSDNVVGTVGATVNTDGIVGGTVAIAGGSGTSNYNDLINKPSINNVTLTGNKSLSDLGAASAADVAAKYTKPSGGIPASDLASAVQTSLDKADTALQTAPVTSVNGQTGAVVLDASDVGAGTYSKPSGGIPASDLASSVQTSLGKADTALQSAPVISVNSKTGAVTLTASDVGAGTYSKPSGGIPKSDLASSVQTSLGKADTALQTAPVASVAGKTGVVTLDAGDVEYDDTDTYAAGTVGAGIAELKSETAKLTDSDATGIDMDLTDEQGHVIARFADGGVQTKAFDSAKSTAVSPTDATDSDVDIVDIHGNVVMRLAGGHIKTKGFDSESVVESIQALTDAVGSDCVVPDYWITYLQDKEAAINALNMALDSGESFIFFTDYHQNTNNKNSAPLMRHIVDHTSITDVVYGGDTTDGGTLPTPQAAEAVVRTFSNLFKKLDIKPVRGNHDCEPLAYQTTNQIPDAAWYDMMIRPIENVVISGNELYFYYDNPNQKIRHIIMDSGGMNDALTETQLTWMKARLTELETGWTAIIFQHMVIESDKTEQTVHLITRGTETLNAIGDVYNTLNCTIAALVCGHVHVDAVVDTNYNFKIISTTCDAGGANAASDWNNPTRTAGTTSEQAFDVYSLDTTNRTINITRIGAGSNRTVQY